MTENQLLVINFDKTQADLKTFMSLGCYGASIVTALTAQNTKGVQAVHAVPPSFVEERVRCSPHFPTRLGFSAVA
jgi:hydroxymethylpyrimidine/phosphomethylpyrimidine kinase